MLYVLIMICINGSQGCTYDAPPTLMVGAPGDRDLPTYSTLSACQKDADAFTQRYGDPGLYAVCRRLAPVRLGRGVSMGTKRGNREAMPSGQQVALSNIKDRVSGYVGVIDGRPVFEKCSDNHGDTLRIEIFKDKADGLERWAFVRRVCIVLLDESGQERDRGAL